VSIPNTIQPTIATTTSRKTEADTNATGELPPDRLGG
jgi:hypothetical protein